MVLWDHLCGFIGRFTDLDEVDASYKDSPEALNLVLDGPSAPSDLNCHLTGKQTSLLSASGMPSSVQPAKEHLTGPEITGFAPTEAYPSSPSLFFCRDNLTRDTVESPKSRRLRNFDIFDFTLNGTQTPD